VSKGEERYAHAAARLLRERWPEKPAREDGGHRDRVVAAMELDVAGRRVRRRVVAGAGLAMAAAATVTLGLWVAGGGEDVGLRVKHVHGPTNTFVRATSIQTLSPAVALLEGDDVRCGDEGGATLGLADGTRLELSPSSHLRVDELGKTRKFLLLHGRVLADVAKLAPSERFIVATPDGQVEVRGTSFSVEVVDAPAGCGEARIRSSVRVREGAVGVRSLAESVLLGPGESWTTPCADPSAVSSSPAPPVDSTAEASAPIPAAPSPFVRRSVTSRSTHSGVARRPGAASQALPIEAPAVSRLDEQNDLLSAAMAAERSGQYATALRKLNELIRRFPESPLLETARIERRRILLVESRP
jgi:ferric-dicitrate binding protein FerR (iron transport regulator)